MFYCITLLCTPIGALVSASVMGTPSASNSFWKERTGANTPASHTVPRIIPIVVDRETQIIREILFYFLACLNTER